MTVVRTPQASGIIGAAPAVVALLVAVLLAGCAAPTGGTPSSTGGAASVLATFRPVDAGTTTASLGADAVVVRARLRSLGVGSDTATARRGTVVVSGPRPLPGGAAALAATGDFAMRSVLCLAPPYRSPAAGGPLPSGCSSPRYSLEAPNLTVDTTTGNSNVAAIAPDPALAPYPSSSAGDDDAHPTGTVLVPLVGGSGQRYLLGPVLLTSSVVARDGARAVFEPDVWLVDVTLTAAGAVKWDTVAQRYFHQLLAMVVDGRVLSAPLTEPNQATFASFGGRVQVSGTFGRATAEHLAADLDSGPLPSPLAVDGRR